MDYLDYETEAREAGVTEEQLRELCQIVRSEFPTDDMMFELHVLGTCIAVREGRVGMEEVLSQGRAAAARRCETDHTAADRGTASGGEPAADRDMRMFDYEGAAKEAGLSEAELEQLCQAVREEFPRDDMMFELHVLGVCMAVRQGRFTIEDVLREIAQAAVTPGPREHAPA